MRDKYFVCFRVFLFLIMRSYHHGKGIGGGFHLSSFTIGEKMYWKGVGYVDDITVFGQLSAYLATT